MSNRVTGKVLRTVACVGILAGASALSGCSSLGGLAFDRTATSSVSSSAVGVSSQTMPRPLGTTRVAAGPFIPPSDIGGNGGGAASALLPVASGQGQAMGSVSTEDLPVLTSSTSQGNATPMSAQSSLAPIAVASKPTLQTAPAAAPSLVSVPSDAYVHVIESGESLYTIARRYDVTAQSIVQANGFSSPDKIFVGQKIVIPGRPDLLARKGPATSAAPVMVASTSPAGSTPSASP